MKTTLLILLVALTSLRVDAPYDVIIENGHVIDGTGSPWIAADVGIRDGRIAAIGNLANASATKRLDARGKVVAPGFIDMLGQSELTILVNPHLPSKIFQGITTEVTGEGGSIAPLNDAIIAADHIGYEHYQITPDWRTLAQYFARLEKQGMGINLATFVGATQVRRMVLGDADKQPTADELKQMRALVADAMREGAVGVSTSLQYAPAPYATTNELIALASEAAKYGGVYATHMRSEGAHIFEALDETFRIAREAKIPVQIWHLKAAGKPQWGQMPRIVAMIDSARRAGLEINANTYAYPAWFNGTSAFIPPWAHDGGDKKMLERLKDPAMRARMKADMLKTDAPWENEWQEIPGPEAVLIAVVNNPKLMPLQGKTLDVIAKDRGKDPIETLMDILVEDNGYTSNAVFAMSEPDVAFALVQPWTSINNDSQGTAPDGLLGNEHPHPRAYGTFPRILRKYVREEKKLTLEEAIRKFTSLPAQQMRLNDRGVLKQGMWADVVVFDADSVRDMATFEKPNQLSVGMKYVLVNGVPVIEDGKMTNALPGQVVRGPGYAKAPQALDDAKQLAVVTTAGWDSITGTLHRYVRISGVWQEQGTATPIVVGRTGLAWGVGFDGNASDGEPHKREGDGRSPAGVFPVDTAFGFDPSIGAKLSYIQLTPGIECVDDTASVYYNGVVDRNAVSRVDWTSSERMRNVAQYRQGAVIGYNGPKPVKGRGSCIFFHIWGGPRKPTVGCTAMDEARLAELLAWLDPKAKPVVVQLPTEVYARVRTSWKLP